MKVARLAGYEGPRHPIPDEREGLEELSRSIFFPKAASWREGTASWPMVLHPDTQKNALIMARKGEGGAAEPVSVTLSLERAITVYGHALRMAYIGGVCTHPDHRGKGLASTLLSASLKILHEHGVDFVYISGRRPMYFGAGANRIGGISEFTVPAEGAALSEGLTLRKAGKGDIPLLCRLNQRDSVRFVRPALDYEFILSSGHCAGRPCEFWVVERQAVPLAYVMVRRTEGERPRAIEIRGERTAVADALGDLAARLDGESITVDVPHGDLLGDLLKSRGHPSSPGGTGGTLKVLDFCRTMNRLRPCFASHLEPKLAASLDFIQAGDRYVILSDDGRITIDGESNMAWTLLGAPKDEEITGLEAEGAVQRMLETSLPIPLPSVYLNMI